MFAIDTVITGVLSLVSKFIPDKAKEAELRAQIELYKLTAEYQNATEQIKTNQQEAASDSIFIAGWRPYIGWVCGAGLTWHFVVVPVVVFISSVFNHTIPLPAFDTISLINLVLGMLGLGGLRTYEKVQAQKLKQNSRNNED